MTTSVIIAIAFVIFFLLLLSGKYIHTVLLATGLVGIFLIEGTERASTIVGSQPFGSTASYTLTTIPMFILMAQFILQAGVVQDLFYVVAKLAGGRRGFLGSLTISAGAALGAVSGSGAATGAALGKVAVPELLRVGFSPRLSGAVAASAGALSGIVPPSIILILYGVATETPVGSLFMAAVVPGILITLVFVGVMLVQLRRDRIRGSEAESDQETIFDYAPSKVKLFLSLAISGLVVLIVFGGIFLGFVTPTEAGALGALSAFLVALIMRKVNLAFMKEATFETVRVTGMVMLIMIAAQVFGSFLSVSLIPRRIVQALEPLVENPIVLLSLLAVLFFILFMFLEGAAVILMTIPVVLPLLAAMEVDVLWFGIFISLLCTLGLLSPPVGLSVFAVSGTSGITSSKIFGQSLIFSAAAAVIVLAAITMLPQMVHWLPGIMN